MRYCIDIDGTICTPTVGRGYEKATPYKNRIQQINELYDEGHYIISLLFLIEYYHYQSVQLRTQRVLCP